MSMIGFISTAVWMILAILFFIEMRKAQKNCQNAIDVCEQAQKGWDEALRINKELSSLLKPTDQEISRGHD